MKFKKLIRQSLSYFDSDCFRVVKIKGVRSIQVYFNDNILSGVVIQTLLSIEGLYFIGIHIEKKYLLFRY